MASFDFSRIPELTPEELQDPYSKFYYYPVNTPPKYMMDAVAPGNLMPQEYAMLPSDLHKLFEPGYLPYENGYTILENGVGCCAINTRLPGITPEMEKWWNSWFRSVDLYYKIWLPGMHFGHQNVITEELGWGTVQVLFPYSFVDVTEGLENDPKEMDPNFVSIMAGSMYFDEDGERFYCSLCHQYRLTDDGMEIRTRSWYGLTLEKGTEFTCRPDPDRERALKRIRILAAHHAWEFSRKAEIMREIYEFSRTL